MNNIYNLACSACIAGVKRQMIQVRYIIPFALELCKWNWQAGKQSRGILNSKVDKPSCTCLAQEKKWKYKSDLLPPANEVCKFYVFTGVCLSTRGVCIRGGVLHPGGCLHPGGRGSASRGKSASRGEGVLHPGGGGLHRGVHNQGGWATPPPVGYYETRSTRRQYASYWNAFLVFQAGALSLYVYR